MENREYVDDGPQWGTLFSFFGGILEDTLDVSLNFVLLKLLSKT